MTIKRRWPVGNTGAIEAGGSWSSRSVHRNHSFLQIIKNAEEQRSLRLPRFSFDCVFIVSLGKGGKKRKRGKGDGEGAKRELITKTEDQGTISDVFSLCHVFYIIFFRFEMLLARVRPFPKISHFHALPLFTPSPCPALPQTLSSF